MPDGNKFSEISWSSKRVVEKQARDEAAPTDWFNQHRSETETLRSEPKERR